MGLLLSVLITCVGVLEVVAFYTNFNFGVTYEQYKTDLTEIARNYAWELRRNHLHHLFPDGDPEEEFSRMIQSHRSKLASTRSISQIKPYKEEDNISIDEDSTYDQISEIDNELSKNIEIFNDKANDIIFVSGSLEKEIEESKIDDLPKDIEETIFTQKENDNLVPEPEKSQTVEEEIKLVPPNHEIEELFHLDKEVQEEIITPSSKLKEMKIIHPKEDDFMNSLLEQLESQIITDEAEFDKKIIDKIEPPSIKKEIAENYLGSAENPMEIIEDICVQKHFVDLTDGADQVLESPIDISEVKLSADVKNDIQELAEKRLLDIDSQIDIEPVKEEIVPYAAWETRANEMKPIIEEIIQKSNVPVEGKQSVLVQSRIDQECAELMKDSSKLTTDEFTPVERVPSPYPTSLFGLSTDNGITDFVVNDDFLRSLDGVKPNRSDDRRRSFRKKRNSSSSSKDRASRDRSNTSIDSNEGRTELDLKEIEALDALAEKNGDFDENFAEESNLQDTINIQNHETTKSVDILHKHEELNSITETDSEGTTTIGKTLDTIQNEEGTPNREENNIQEASNIQICEILQNRETNLDRITSAENSEIVKNEKDAIPSIKEKINVINNHIQTMQPSPEEPQSEDKNTIEIIPNTPNIPRDQQTSTDLQKPIEDEVSAQVSNITEEAHLPDLAEGKEKIKDPAMLHHRQQNGRHQEDTSSIVVQEISEQTTNVSPTSQSEDTTTIVKVKTKEKEESNSNRGESKNELTQKGNSQMGSLPQGMKELKEGASITKEKMNVDEESIKEPTEELKKVDHSIHKMEETVPNPSLKTLAQEASAKLTENRRKFFKTASVNSFEDASSSKNEEIHRELNKANGNDENDHQRTTTTISLPNSDAFWVKE